VAVKGLHPKVLSLVDLATLKLVGTRYRIPETVRSNSSVLDILENGRMLKLQAPASPTTQSIIDDILPHKHRWRDEPSFLAHIHEIMGFLMTRAYVYYHMCCVGVSSFGTYPSEDGTLATLRQMRKQPPKPTTQRRFFNRERSNSSPAHRVPNPPNPAGQNSNKDCVASLLAREICSLDAATQASFYLVPATRESRENAVKVFMKRMHVFEADRDIIAYFAKSFIMKQACYKNSFSGIPPIQWDDTPCIPLTVSKQKDLKTPDPR